MKTFKLLFIITLVSLFAACGKDDVPNDNPQNDLDYNLGWYGDDSVSEIPTSINFGFGNGNLPSSYNIVDKFPPIGDQGNYGTCVAWAVAYNAKTALSGMDHKLSPSELSSVQNQFSPKDLFWAIPDNQKGNNCNGTNFSFALELLQKRGVASMSTVPYTGLGNCTTNNSDPAWEQEAKNHKIEYWRKIEPTTTSIKQYISNNIPVILGAKLADNFMSWNSNDVLTSHSSFSNVGQHAYHAMVIAGYDDNKGPNGAFRVINSWSENWGDLGYIWIDYNFLINEFGVNSQKENSLFIMANQEGEEKNPPTDDPTPNASGVDLAPWVFSDYSTYDISGYWNERQLSFNLYNIGNTTAYPSSNWSIYYLYFNAYDANDYGVLFYDEFNQSIAAETYDCPTANHCIINTSIESNSDFASKAFGSESIIRTYYVPEITGDYYLLMLADAGDVFQEEDEQNNFFYTSLNPVYFNNGNALLKKNDSSHSSRNDNGINAEVINQSINTSLTNGKMKNAYTSKELLQLLNNEKNNGNLKRKVSDFQHSMKKQEVYVSEHSNLK